MRDPVNAVIAQRQGLDRGFPGSLVLSAAGHLLLAASALLAALIGSREPPIKVVPGFAVALPPGGGGAPSVAPPATAAPAPTLAPEPAPEPPKPEPPAKVLKPPEPERAKGLPDPDAKPTKKKPERIPPPSATGSAGGRGTTSPATPGFSIGPPGPGVPGGTDPFGDWYLAGVQRKIWMIWAQQVKAGMNQPITVSFTILADGSVTDVQLLQSSGVYLLDSAAQRAIVSAAPFGPLPKDYGTNRITIQGIFKPAY